MELNDLKYFKDAVEKGSIRASAEKNFVSSPAISIAIKRLEESLEVKLLKHAKNKFVPTEEAILLAQKAKDLFQNIENIKEEIRAPKEIEGTWRIGTQQSIAQQFFPKLLVMLKQTYPKLEIIVNTSTTQKNLEALKNGEIDSAIMVSNVDLKGFATEALHSGTFNIYGQNSNLENYYLTEPTKETKYLEKTYKKKFGKSINITSRISSWGTLKLFAEAGLGNTYLPDYLESKKLKVLFPNDNQLKMKYEILAVASPPKFHHRKAQAIIDLARKVMNR